MRPRTPAQRFTPDAANECAALERIANLSDEMLDEMLSQVPDRLLRRSADEADRWIADALMAEADKRYAAELAHDLWLDEAAE